MLLPTLQACMHTAAVSASLTCTSHADLAGCAGLTALCQGLGHEAVQGPLANPVDQLVPVCALGTGIAVIPAADV